MFAALVHLLPCVALAEYRVETGDVLEISVAGLPDLRQRATVNLDGKVSFPLIGSVAAVGLSLSDLRAKVQEEIAKKAFRQWTTDGRENLVAIWPDEITVDVAEYNPVYLNGDVAKPGEQKYRPGLTVRQAVALAGGYELMRFRMTDPHLVSADLRSEYDVLWTEFAREQAALLRLRTELGDKVDIDAKGYLKIPIPPSLGAEIADREAEHMRAREADYQREKAYLQRAMDQLEGQLSVLLQQQQRGEEATKADTVDLESMREYFRKGTISSSRMQEARRSLLWSSTTFLQSVAQVAQIKREREELSRKLQRIDDQRRIDLLRDIQNSEIKIASIRSRLQAVGEKLLYTATVRSQLVRGKGGKPDVVVFRKGEQGRTRVVADEDTELFPGDSVEVALRVGVEEALRASP